MRVNNDHWDVLLDFANKHPEIITNRSFGISGRDKLNKLWQELTNTLNGLGFGEKTVEEWKKTLADYKSKTKQKASKIKQHQYMTGGGPKTELTLSTREEKLLSVMGTTAVQGDLQAKEFGIPQKKLILHDMPTNLENYQRQPHNIPEITNHELLLSCSSSPKDVEGTPKTTLIRKRHNLEIPDPLPRKKKVIHINEVDIELNDILLGNNENIEIEEVEEVSDLPSSVVENRDNIGTTFTEITNKQPSKTTPSYKNKQRALQEAIEDMNNSTLEVLKNIDKNIENMSRDIKRMADAIVTISENF